MKIIRNDIEFELTPDELREAYYEKKREYDTEDIRSRYSVPDDKIDEVVDRFNDALGRNDDFWCSYWITIEYICEDMGFEEAMEED